MNEYRFLVTFEGGDASAFSTYATTMGQALALMGVELTRALAVTVEPTGFQLEFVRPCPGAATRLASLAPGCPS